MGIVLKIREVEKGDHALPHRRIKSISGAEGSLLWRYSHAEAVRHIEERHFHFYIEKNSRALRVVVGQTPEGEKFLKTHVDTDGPAELIEWPGEA